MRASDIAIFFALNLTVMFNTANASNINNNLHENNSILTSSTTVFKSGHVEGIEVFEPTDLNEDDKNVFFDSQNSDTAFSQQKVNKNRQRAVSSGKSNKFPISTSLLASTNTAASSSAIIRGLDKLSDDEESQSTDNRYHLSLTSDELNQWSRKGLNLENVLNWSKEKLRDASRHFFANKNPIQERTSLRGSAFIRTRNARRVGNHAELIIRGDDCEDYSTAGEDSSAVDNNLLDNSINATVMYCLQMYGDGVETNKAISIIIETLKQKCSLNTVKAALTFGKQSNTDISSAVYNAINEETMETTNARIELYNSLFANYSLFQNYWQKIFITNNLNINDIKTITLLALKKDHSSFDVTKEKDRAHFRNKQTEIFVKCALTEYVRKMAIFNNEKEFLVKLFTDTYQREYNQKIAQQVAEETLNKEVFTVEPYNVLSDFKPGMSAAELNNEIKGDKLLFKIQNIVLNTIKKQHKEFEGAANALFKKITKKIKDTTFTEDDRQQIINSIIHQDFFDKNTAKKIIENFIQRKN
ncbi:MAG: hypothetical protein IJ730_02830 [Alphaproteobacteria bacterium]|nr:hypothetical protein [Alphaproteobacteria bacterium]